MTQSNAPTVMKMINIPQSKGHVVEINYIYLPGAILRIYGDVPPDVIQYFPGFHMVSLEYLDKVVRRYFIGMHSRLYEMTHERRSRGLKRFNVNNRHVRKYIDGFNSFPKVPLRQFAHLYEVIDMDKIWSIIGKKYHITETPIMPPRTSPWHDFSDSGRMFAHRFGGIGMYDEYANLIVPLEPTSKVFDTCGLFRIPVRGFSALVAVNYNTHKFAHIKPQPDKAQWRPIMNPRRFNLSSGMYAIMSSHLALSS